SVLVIGHSKEKEKEWTDKGAHFETADIIDSVKLKELFARSERIFILNPPADPAGDAEAQELKQVESILKALKGLKPEKIVMASTYGAQEGTGIFDLGTLYQLEQGLKAHGAPLAIIRSAYYMSNLDMPVQMAMETGKFTTVLPADFKLPMVAPTDIGKFAAELIQDDRAGTFYIQAKEEYSANDAAKVLSGILKKDITTNEIPEAEWASYMEENGFSKESAQSFIGMTRLTIYEKFEAPDPEYGETTLEEYLQWNIGAKNKDQR
ncbi:MAG: NmrA family transcriptional regulator, partial [Chitinophagaceae bacterium]